MTVADVAARLQRDIGAGDAPSESDVDGFIDQAESRVHAILRMAGIASSKADPAADTDDFLKTIALSGAVWMTAIAVYPGEGFAADNDLVKAYERAWKDNLKELKSNPSLATGTTGDAPISATGAPSPTSDPSIFPRKADFGVTEKF